MKQFERAGKRLGLAIARRWIAGERLDPAAIDLSRLERILVVRQDRRLGNLVLLTSLLLGLRRAASRAEITVVAPHAFAGILDGHPAVDRILPLDHRRLLRSPWTMAPWRTSVRSTRPELAIDASPIHRMSFLNGLVTWGSGAPYRLGYERGEAGVFLNLLAPVPAEPAHESVLLHDLLRILRPDLPPAPLPELAIPAGARDAAARAYRRWGIAEGSPVVGLHPGGRRRKRWPIERFAQAARDLGAQGCTVIIFWGEAERPFLETMGAPGPRRIFAPPTDVRGFLTLACRLDAFVSGDLGPMHLAAALGIPCVAIFRLDDHGRYGPRGAGHRVLYRRDGEVAPEQVVPAVLEVLDTRRDSGRLEPAPGFAGSHGG